MNKKSLDLIIPAYNAHKHIINSLSSVAIQNIDFPLNIIIVNDGSKNDYNKEVDLFKNRLNIKVINLEHNSGVGVARQVGLDNSTGDFITFLDSDDLLYSCDSLQTLYNLLEDGKNDYGYGSIIIEWDDERNLCEEHDGCLHGKIFNKKFIDKNKIKFNNTRTSEDNSFNHICLFKANHIKKSNDVVYIYNENKNSLTKGLDIDRKISNLVDYIDNVLYTLDNLDNIYEKDILEYYLSSYLYVWNSMMIYKKEHDNIKNFASETLAKFEKYNELYTMEYIEKEFPGVGFSLFRKFIINEVENILKK